MAFNELSATETNEVMRKIKDYRMMQSRDQFEESYKLIGTDPAAWLEQALGMKIAADPVLESLMALFCNSGNKIDVRLKKIAYVRAYMLLMGYAFENIIKAIAAKRGLLAMNPNLGFDKSFKQEKGGHGLSAAAGSLDLDMSASEQAYLRRLEEYLHWAGRYPVSLKRGTYVDGHSERQLTFISSDPQLGDALFHRWADLIENAT